MFPLRLLMCELTDVLRLSNSLVTGLTDLQNIWAGVQSPRVAVRLLSPIVLANRRARSFNLLSPLTMQTPQLEIGFIRLSGVGVVKVENGAPSKLKASTNVRGDPPTGWPCAGGPRGCS